MADYTVGLALGYGRTKPVASACGSGYNAYPFRDQRKSHIAPSGAKVTVTPQIHTLYHDQDHWRDGRPSDHSRSELERVSEKSRFAKAFDMESAAGMVARFIRIRWIKFKDESFQNKKPLHQWGMSIDLNPASAARPA